MSGEDFVSHSIAVAQILAEQLLDTATIAAALLHDVVEDSDVRAGGHRPRVRRRDRRHRRRAHQDLQPHLPQRPPRSRSRTTGSCCSRSRRTRASSSSSWATGCTTCGRSSTSPPERRQPHRARDAGDLRAAGAPLRHGGHQGGAGGPRVQVPGARRLPRRWSNQVAVEAGGAGADDPQAARRRWSTSSSARAIEGSRSPAARSTSGRSSRRCGSANKGFDEIYDLMAIRVIVEHGAGVLPRARHDPPQLDAAAGAHQGLHREPQVERATSRSTPRSSAPAASSSRCRSAPRRCTARPSSASRRTGSTSATASADELDQHLRLVPPAARAAAGHAQPGGVPRVPQGRPVPGRDLRLHAAGRREAAAQGRDADRLRASTCIPRSASTARARRSTAASRRCTASSRAATRSRSSPVPPAKPSRDWLSHVRTARARHKIKQWINHEEEKVSVAAREGDPRPRGAPPPARAARRRPRWRARRRRSRSPTGGDSRSRSGRGDVAIGQVIRALYPGPRRSTSCRSPSRRCSAA